MQPLGTDLTIVNPIATITLLTLATFVSAVTRIALNPNSPAIYHLPNIALHNDPYSPTRITLIVTRITLIITQLVSTK